MLKFTFISVLALAAGTLCAQTRQVQGSSAMYNSQFRSSGGGSYNSYHSGSRSYSGGSGSSPSSSSFGGGSGSYTRGVGSSANYDNHAGYASDRTVSSHTTAIDKQYASSTGSALTPWSNPEQHRVVIVYAPGYVASSELAQLNRYEPVQLPKTLELAPLGAVDLGPAKGEYHVGAGVTPGFAMPIKPLFALPSQQECQQYTAPVSNFLNGNNGICELTGLRHRCGIYCSNGSYWRTFMSFSCYNYLDMKIRHPKTVQDLMTLLRTYYACVGGYDIGFRAGISAGDLSVYTQHYMYLVQRINSRR